MAEGDLGKNLTFPIKNADGTSFHGLSLKKATYNTVVMSLGDKITGDVYYSDNTLAVTMQEYIEYTDNGSVVKFHLVNPPTIVKEGMVSDNSGMNGMTKYSFEFYHPMYMLGNFPFTDVAVTSSQQKYLSQNKTFSWIGTFTDFVAKLNKNLQGTQWMVTIGSSVQNVDRTKLSDVMSFDKQTMAEAIKKGYETWEIPYVVDVVKSGESGYSEGKRFKVQYGLPTTEILVSDGQGGQTPYVFQCGQGVGLKNNSRTPRNNKIVTRIAGYGSETNIQYGYPQIPWTGDQSWNYTVNNSSSSANSYPIYDGIVNGQRTRLIKHPFTRTHLMPSIYRDTVNRKVNPLATGYDPTIEIKDYYDADGTYDNPMVSDSPSYEIHEFEKIKPELGDNRTLVSVAPMTEEEAAADYSSMSSFLEWLKRLQTQTNISAERAILNELYERIQTQSSWSQSGEDEEYWFSVSFTKDGYFAHVTFESANINFDVVVLYSQSLPTPDWDDTMDDDGNYVQSYFKVTIPQLDFDIYACAAVTQEMNVNMRSGDCLGCTFPVMVDWDDYKANFYDEDGNFAPSGEQRDFEKYPNSANGQVTLILKKEIETFGTLMPNIYQQPAAGDKFVILGIALPQVYVTNAESRLDADMLQYMRDNNVYYFDYPLKFDEYFLATHTNILSQMKNNVVVRFNYAGTVYALYIKQMSVKFGDKPLPQYDITLTDDVEIVLNQIGQVTSEVSSLRLMLGGSGDDKNYDKRYLRKDVDDTARGFLTLMKGMQVGSRFVTGLLGQGGVFRTEADGTTYIEADKLYIRMKAYFDTVEVRRYLHSGGNRIASAAGMNCTRVEYIDANGSVTTAVEDAKAFKCYFKAQDDSRKITNDFVVGDLAYCKETNVDTTTIEMHGYWRLVTGKSSSPNSDNEHWILLSNKTSETVTIDGTSYTHAGYQSGSDAPIAYDDIIQLGNIADTTRQGAIVEMVSGADAPVYQIFQGINTFSLVDKNYVSMGYASGNTNLHSAGHAYLEVMGDFYFGDSAISNPSSYIKYNSTTRELDIKANVKFTSPYTEQETDLEAFAAAVKSNEDDLQAQIDGEIDTWFYEGTPTLSNAPAVDWNTAALKERHLGDLYYDIGTGQTAGFAYRFIKTTSGGVDTYSWQYLEDTAITEALAMAAQAQDTADHKRRVFLTTPTPPYDQGDLWANAIYPSNYTGETDEANHKYKNDILRCKISKASGAEFSINDWQLASKYTDDSALYSFIENTYTTDKTNLQQQIDGKAETWYQDADPSGSWTTDELKANHIGDLWCDTSANGGKKTYIYQSETVSGTTTYYWAEQAVPESVFDEIDGKAAIYTNTFASHPTDYNKNDLWILPAAATVNNVSYPQGEVLTAIRDYSGTSTWQADWSKKVRYTDDTALTTFINGSYASTVQSLSTQIDQKADTWYQTSDPAASWTTAEQKASHVGDLWYKTTDGTTWYYKDNGSSANPRYAWVQENVPNAVFDKIDGKASIFVVQPSNYKANDLWILAANTTVNGTEYKQGEVLTSSSDSATFVASHWSKKVRYTDDSSLTTFLNGTYTTDKTNLQQQIDQKAETWYQATDPSTAWTTSALKSAHIGDLWHNSSSSTISGIEAGQDAMWNGTSWVPSSVPQDVFDKIDGKADIFVSKPTTYNVNDLWIIESSLSSTDMPTGCKSGDIVISSASRTNSYQKDDWTKKDRYTDDTVVNQIITKYGQILNITATAEGVGEALGKLRNVLGSSTEISGGLVLTNIIYMRDLAQTPKVRAGISGLYKTAETGTGYKGYGTAAWFGGGVSNGVPIDHEVSTSATDYAKSLFRFDGSGYVAGGNLTWDKNGNVTIQGFSINATTLQLGGVGVATSNDLTSYLPLSAGSGKKLTGSLYSQTIVPKSNNTYDLGGASYYWRSLYVKKIYLTSDLYFEVDGTSVKLNGSFYATGGISALGSGTSGGGGISLSEPLSSINNINANPTSANKTLVWNGSSWTYGNITSGSVTGVNVGSTQYAPVNGIVTLPAYPSTLDNIADGTTRKLANYLPLSGGTITGALGKSSNYLIKPVADYRTSNSPRTGCIAITLPATIGSTMVSMWVDVYNYSTNTSFSVHCGGYTYSNSTWQHNPFALVFGASHRVRFGHNGTSFVVYIGETDSTWAYPQVTVRDVVLGYSPTYANWYKDWTISFVTSVSNVTADITRYAITSDNIGSQSVSYATSSGSCSGNAASATKLQTARTLWGQSFDGTANVDGTMTVSGSVIINQSSSSRNNGVIGIYDYTRAATVWAMGSSYNIAADGSGLGNLYGFAYAYKTLASVGNLAGGQQIVFANAGTVYVAFGSDGLWSTGIKCTGNATIGGTLGVTGNLTGTTIYGDKIQPRVLAINHYTDSFHEGNIRCAIGYTANSIPSSYCATPTNRGNGTYMSASNNSSYSRLVFTALSGIYLDGTAYVSGSAIWHAGNSNLTTVDWACKALTAAGAATVGGTLGVTGATTLSSTLAVANAITLSGNTAAKKRIYFGDTSHYIELDTTGFHFSHGIYSDSFISALGSNSSSPSISLHEPLATINNIGTNPSSSGQTLVWNGSSWTYGNITSGSVTGVNVGSTQYAPVNGIVSLPAYPSTLDSIGDGTTRKLSNYLPLTGGTLTGSLSVNGTLTVKNFMYLYKDVSTNSDSGVKTSDQRIYVIVPTATTATNTYALRFIAQYNPNRTNPTSPYTTYTTYFLGGLGSISFSTAGAGAQSYQTLTLGNTTKRNHDTAPAYAGRISLYQPQDAGASATVRTGTIQTAVLTGNRIYTLPDATGTIALTTTNVASATKLATSRTLWGRPFDGTANVTGALEDVTNIDSILNFNTSLSTLNISSDFTTVTPLIINGSTAVWPSSNRAALNVYGQLIVQNTVSSNYRFQFGMYNDNLTPYIGIHDYDGTSREVIGLYSSSPSYREEDLLIGKGFLEYTKSNGSITFLGRTYIYGANIHFVVNDASGTTSTSSVQVMQMYAGGKAFVGTPTRHSTLASINGHGHPCDLNAYEALFGKVYLHKPNTANETSATWLEYNSSADAVYMKVNNGASIYSFDVSGAMTGVKNIDSLVYFDTTNSRIGIGTSSPSYKLQVNGNVSISGTGSLLMNENNIYMYYYNSSTNAYICTYTSSGYRAIALAFDKTGYYEFTTNQFYAKGGIKSDRYVTALSDARYKKVIKDVSMTVEQVASMPAVLFKWKDGRNDNSIYAGSIAQNWQTVLPEVVLKDDDKDGTLSMQYGVAALVASIITARKVVDHEKRISELEMENNALKREIEQLKAA